MLKERVICNLGVIYFLSILIALFIYCLIWGFMKTREGQTKRDYMWLSLIDDSLLSLLLQPATYTLNYILIIYAV